MTKIKDWQAWRSGRGITISGVDAKTGQPVKIVGVDKIASRALGTTVIATVRNGETHELV